MRRFFLTFAIVAAWASWVWADCKPRDYYTRSAKIYINPSQGKQDLKRAEQLVVEGLKCYPEDGEMQYTAAWLYSQKKEFPKMMDALNAAIKSSPQWGPKAETLKAFVFAETFNLANGFLEKATKSATKKDSVKYFRQAVDLYKGVVLIDSTATGPYKNLSFAYYALKIPDTSCHYDGVVFKLKPDSARWGYDYALCLVNQQKYDEAIGVLEKVVRKDSLHWDAWGLLGQLYGAKDSLDKMVYVYQKLLRQYPDSAEFLGQLAVYNLSKGTNAKTSKEGASFFRRADSLYTRYLAKNPTDSNSWYNHGLALTSLGGQEKAYYTKAADVLKMATEKFPGFADAWEALSGAYAHLGRAKEAKDAYAKTEKLRGKPATQK
ncbi:MAG: tetratricopeptide repeat protein [Limisphaerales bacterium]